jgi:hypothetical protein
MKLDVPYFVISYGDFAKTKKLFYYERNGVCQWPIFTDPSNAPEFIATMENALRAGGDDRNLAMQVCSDINNAVDMFEVIMAHVPNLLHVSLNPNADSDDIYKIEDCYDMLRSSLSKQMKSSPSS